MLANIFLPARDSRLPEEYRLRSGVACSLGLFTEQERCMAKIAIRFLILSMFTTSLLVTSVVAPVEAATTSSKHVNKKRVRVVHQRPNVAGPAAGQYPKNYDDDFDRKAAGGGY
jgi:hypothetical protein